MPSCNMGLDILAQQSITADAVGADPKMGDGCGMLVQIPHRFFAAECAKLGIWLPEPGEYGVAQLFMPRDEEGYAKVVEIVEKVVADEGLTLLGWRDVPVDNADLSENVKATEPLHRQVFIGKAKEEDEAAFERRLFLARKVISNTVYDLEDSRTAGYYPVSLSSRTIVYKGMVLVTQLGSYFRDLARPALERRAPRSCTSASPPTPSPAGSWRIPLSHGGA